MKYRITSYNIENMREMFRTNQFIPQKKENGLAAAATLAQTTPHIAGIVEASHRAGDHHTFLNTPQLAPLGLKLLKSKYKRGKQDLVFYYRDPFEVISVDEHVAYYNDWLEDIDHDTIKEQLHFERRPLEVVFFNRRCNRKIMFILVSFKSKGVFSTTDIHAYEHLALANRKKLYGQAKKVRARVDELLAHDPNRAVVVMGDINDEPGLDHFERILGVSAVETVTGTIYQPDKILHNTLWHYKTSDRSTDLWTTSYPDRIVNNFQHHRAWLDHILVSPAMLKPDSPVRLVPDSGAIVPKTTLATLASDHYPIHCDIIME